jgi:hypothetical protein
MFSWAPDPVWPFGDGRNLLPLLGIEAQVFFCPACHHIDWVIATPFSVWTLEYYKNLITFPFLL